MENPISQNFERFLLGEYFKCGSINKVFHEHKYDLPISFAGYARILNKYGIIKSAGPNSKLSESLYMLSLLANYKVSLAKIYHRYAPKNLQVSTNTLHRILHYTRLGLTRRQGAAIIISPHGQPDKILLASDQSLNGSFWGNKGDLTLPLGHSKIGEAPQDSIGRILQNEVFTDDIIDRHFPWHIIPKHIKPILCVNVADILVSVYRLELPKNIDHFSSFKLVNHRFYRLDSLPNQPFRPGIKDMLFYCANLKDASAEIHVYNSQLNTQILALAKQPVK